MAKITAPSHSFQAGRSTLEMERLHERVQASLGKHFLARYEDSGQLQHLEALMAHTTADADLLLSKLIVNPIIFVVVVFVVTITFVTIAYSPESDCVLKPITGN